MQNSFQSSVLFVEIRVNYPKSNSKDSVSNLLDSYFSVSLSIQTHNKPLVGVCFYPHLPAKSFWYQCECCAASERKIRTMQMGKLQLRCRVQTTELAKHTDYLFVQFTKLSTASLTLSCSGFNVTGGGEVPKCDTYGNQVSHRACTHFIQYFSPWLEPLLVGSMHKFMHPRTEARKCPITFSDTGFNMTNLFTDTSLENNAAP